MVQATTRRLPFRGAMDGMAEKDSILATQWKPFRSGSRVTQHFHKDHSGFAAMESAPVTNGETMDIR